MDIDLKLTILEAIESIGNLRDTGYLGAAGAWSDPNLSKYGVWLMAGAAIAGLIAKAAGAYKVRLLKRLETAPATK